MTTDAFSAVCFRHAQRHDIDQFMGQGACGTGGRVIYLEMLLWL